MSTADGKETKFTGLHMLIIMICFFGVIITANVVMAVFASYSWTGLLVKNTYVESQKFNTYITEAEKQNALGWRSDVGIRDQQVQFSLLDRQGAVVEGLSVTLKARRPTHEREDRKISLVKEGPGRYASKERLAPGVWDVDVLASVEGQVKYQKTFRVFVKEE